jgi:hypothetical protein
LAWVSYAARSPTARRRSSAVAHHRHGEVVHVLAEQRNTGDRARLEVPLQAQVELDRLERLQRLLLPEPYQPGVSVPPVTRRSLAYSSLM